MNIGEIYEYIQTNYPNLKIIQANKVVCVFDANGYRCISIISDMGDIQFNKYKLDDLIWTIQSNFNISLSNCTVNIIDKGIKDYIYSWEKMLEYIKQCKIKDRLADMENDFRPQ